jgi:hypothetical protein
MEPFGASVVQKAAIVVRSRPPCENREIPPHTETEGTYDDVRVLDAFSQHISSVFPSPGFRRVHSLPYRTEALLSERDDAEGAMEGQHHPLLEGPGVPWGVWLSVEDPVRRRRGDITIVLRIEYGRHLV